MKYIKSLLFILLTQLLLAGCVAVGVVATKNPLVKLNDAEHLLTIQGRHLVAEKLIHEAISIYRSEGNYHGLGKAHQLYADLLKSPSIGNWELVYRKNGFIDKSVTFDNRKEKAKEYFKYAIEYYSKAVDILEASKQYDTLTNLYFNLTSIFSYLDDKPNLCKNLELSIESYKKNIEANPDAKPITPRGYTNLEEFFKEMKIIEKCA